MIDLGPGVQVGEVLGGAGGAVQRLEVGLELDEIARHEARRHPQPTHDLHQQPGAVAARPRARLQGFVGRLHARLHAGDVADLSLELLVERDKIIHRVHRLTRQRAHEFGEQRPRRLRIEKSGEVGAQRLRIFERKDVGIGLDEEVERIDHLHVGDEVDSDRELLGLLRKDVAGDPVAVGVLLPVHEMLGGQHFERIALDGSAAVRRRPQPDHLRAEADRPVVAVAGDVVEADEERH